MRASFAQCTARLPTDLLFVFGGSHLGWPLQIVEAFDIRSLTWKECSALEFGKFLKSEGSAWLVETAFSVKCI